MQPITAEKWNILMQYSGGDSAQISPLTAESGFFHVIYM
jgi:hypothetical protein